MDAQPAIAPPALLTRLRERGWRVTPQRRAVAEALNGDHVHLTADEVHKRARAILPEVALATVYNTLNELVAMGEVAEVRYAPGPSRYDPNVGPAPHHHLLCTSCGALLDVDATGVAVPELGAAERQGFSVDGVEVVFRGTCASCRDLA
jgi:Fur family ferric uptake transcriptional regulator